MISDMEGVASNLNSSSAAFGFFWLRIIGDNGGKQGTEVGSSALHIKCLVSNPEVPHQPGCPLIYAGSGANGLGAVLLLGHCRHHGQHTDVGHHYLLSIVGVGVSPSPYVVVLHSLTILRSSLNRINEASNLAQAAFCSGVMPCSIIIHLSLV